MFKNLEREDFYQIEHSMKKQLNPFTSTIMLPMISVITILFCLIPINVGNQTLFYLDFWASSIVFYKILIGFILLFDIVLIFTKIRYKRPDIAILFVSFYLFAFLISISTAFSVFIEEALGERSIYYHLFMILMLCSIILSFFTGYYKITHGVLRKSGVGINNYFQGFGSKLLLIVTAVGFVVLLIMNGLIELNLMFLLIMMIGFFLKYPIREAIYASHYLKKYYNVMDSDAIEFVKREELKSIIRQSKNDKSSGERNHNDEAEFEQSKLNLATIMYVIKPLQYILLVICSVVLINILDVFDSKVVPMVISFIIYCYLIYQIFKWIVKYELNYYEKLIINVFLALNILMLLLFACLSIIENSDVLKQNEFILPSIFLVLFVILAKLNLGNKLIDYLVEKQSEKKTEIDTSEMNISRMLKIKLLQTLIGIVLIIFYIVTVTGFRSNLAFVVSVSIAYTLILLVYFKWMMKSTQNLLSRVCFNFMMFLCLMSLSFAVFNGIFDVSSMSDAEINISRTVLAVLFFICFIVSPAKLLCKK